MDDTSGTTGVGSATGKPTRGKDQLSWGDDVWQMIDDAVNDEIMRSRMAAKFLPSVYVHKKKTTIESDVVVQPTAGSADQSLSVEEAASLRIQLLRTQIRLSSAQVDSEGEYDAELLKQLAAKSAQPTKPGGQVAANRPHRASTAVSLALQAARLLAQADDLICHTGALAVAYHPLFTTGAIQSLDPNLLNNLDGGLLATLPSTSIDQFQPLPTTATPATAAATAVANVLLLPPSQIVIIRPKIAGTPASPTPLYQELLLNGVAEGVARLQRLNYNDNYALVASTVPFGQFFMALPGSLTQPIEPMSHLISAGILGTGNLPPFPVLTDAGALATTATLGLSTSSLSTGLPTHYFTDPTKTTVGSAIQDIQNLIGANTNVLYMGFLVSLSGNSMDVVRGLMEDGLDVCMSLAQKSPQEDFIFNLAQRFALRVKDRLSTVAILHTDR